MSDMQRIFTNAVKANRRVTLDYIPQKKWYVVTVVRNNMMEYREIMYFFDIDGKYIEQKVSVLR